MIRFTLTIRNHGFSVQVMFQQDKRIMTQFCEPLAVYETSYNKRLGKSSRKFKYTYSTYVSKRDTYGLHIGLLTDFKEHLVRSRVGADEIQIKIVDPQRGAPTHIKLSPKAVPKDYQEPIVAFVTGPGNTRVLPIQTGQGKEQPLDALIKVPGGWSTMGEMQVGTEVIAKDGSTTVVTGVHPQGVKDIYRITFGDDRSTECGGEHLWKILDYGKSTPTPAVWEIVNTFEIIARLKDFNSGLYIELCDSEQLVEQNAMFDPYSLGIQLGIGQCHFYKRGMLDVYLSGATHQRLALLQGLMDSYGGINVDGSGTLVVRNQQLADDLIYLVRSLGGMARLTKSPFSSSESRTVSLRLQKPEDMFTCEHRLKQLRETPSYNGDLKLPIVSVELVRQAEAQCISIAHPEHLYITDDFIVTHNTFISLYSAAKYGTRTAVCMGAMHIDTWVRDASWIYANAKDCIVVVRGKKDLCTVIALAKENKLTESLLLFTVNTLRDYLSEYEQTGMSTYGCLPAELYNVLGVGFRIVDECHENLHFNFRHTIETNIEKILYLSATIESNDALTNRMYAILFPINNQYLGLSWNRYAVVNAIGYNLKNSEYMRCTSSMGYSHVAFEQTIMRHPGMLRNYMSMLIDIIDKVYVKNYIPGQKLLIYMSTVDMCNIMAEHIVMAYEDRFSCSSFTAEHDDAVLHTNDIIVSTPIKSGSGKDIKKLVAVISTVAIDAREKNIQMLGRLRNLSEVYPGLDPTYWYLVCLSIPKHVDYHRNKLVLFGPLVKQISSFRSSYII